MQPLHYPQQPLLCAGTSQGCVCPHCPRAAHLGWNLALLEASTALATSICFQVVALFPRALSSVISEFHWAVAITHSLGGKKEEMQLSEKKIPVGISVLVAPS